MGSFWIRRAALLACVIALVAVAAAAVPPIGDGVDRALKPARDLAGWIGDSLDAKREKGKLETQLNERERALVALQLQAVENRQLRKLYELNTTLDLDQYAPVQARVSGRLGGRLPTQVRIDRGEVAGIRAGQPVVDGDGLVGRVTTVAPAYAIVSLIDHETFGTGAFVSGKEIKATVKASATRGGELELTLVNASLILRGDIVYTSGSSSDDTPSFYPRGLPVGRVVAVETGDGNLDSRVRVRPVSDLVNLDRVEVLTTP